MKFHNFGYLLKEGVKNLWKNRTMSIASIGVLILLNRFADAATAAAATPVVCVVMLCFALLALVQYFRLYIRAKSDQSKPQSEVN